MAPSSPPEMRTLHLLKAPDILLANDKPSMRELPFAKHPSTPSARMRLPFFSAPMAGFLVLGRSIGLYPLAGFDYIEWEN
jgi:hypothetical protein